MRNLKQPVSRPVRLALALVTLLTAVLLGRQLDQADLRLPSITQHQPGQYRVESVIDGDTIVVEAAGYRETVRLIGVDTPETHDPRKPVQCFGQAAAAKTKELIGSGRVRLETDPRDDDRDKYRRLLRYVYLQDGRLLNAELIRQGYAFAYTIFPFTKSEEFRILEQEARPEGRGLWSACSVNESKPVKQTNPA